jgi:uncharacterized cupin superfamily protein
MTDKSDQRPIAIVAAETPPRTKPSTYPEPFFSRMLGREKRMLGDQFGFKNFGVNHTTLASSGESSLMHKHTKQDEFIYILAGAPTLATEDGETVLSPGMCAGFPANGAAHHLINRTDGPVIYLEIGDRTSGDEGSYPQDDLKAVMGADGKWKFTHKDGSYY